MNANTTHVRRRVHRDSSASRSSPFKSGRSAAKKPDNTVTTLKAASATNQLLSRHQGRNDQVRETSVAAGHVDAHKQSPKTIAAATRPATSPTGKPFLRLGFIVPLNTPNTQAQARRTSDQGKTERRTPASPEAIWLACSALSFSQPQDDAQGCLGHVVLPPEAMNPTLEVC